ncbi:MAG: hypothetical protein IKN87_04295 [Bacilli bacterium]|nr:hypothetical protein [Bacilli bacterium]
MKNVKTYENFKKLIGGSKLVFAGAGLGATLLMTGCSGCSVEPEPASEVVVDVTSETPSQIEIIETSEQPSEEISEEPVVEEAELPELPILDENGNVYVPNEITLDQVYAKIDKMVEENEFESDLERDKAIAVMIYINSPYISKDTFMAVKEDYLGNMLDGDILTLSQVYFDKHAIPLNYLFLDDKQADAVSQIMNYRRQNKDSEEYYNLALDYILFSSENIGYNPINYYFYGTDPKRVLIKELKANLDIDTIDAICGGCKEVDGSIEKTFADGKSYTFEGISNYFENYQSSHIEKSLTK